MARVFGVVVMEHLLSVSYLHGSLILHGHSGTCSISNFGKFDMHIFFNVNASFVFVPSLLIYSIYIHLITMPGDLELFIESKHIKG